MSTYLPTIKQLQYLVALHEHGHFGRAAEAMFVSQSTLSAGIRELDYLGGEIHLITGNLDSKPEESALLAHHPRAAHAPNEHWVVPLAQGKAARRELHGRRVRGFDEGAAVEGLALYGDDVWYVHDDDVIRLSVDRAEPAGGGARRRPGGGTA